jgi:hypothetical protein
VRTPDELRTQWARLRELTDRPFAINHAGHPFVPVRVETVEEIEREPGPGAKPRLVRSDL